MSTYPSFPIGRIVTASTQKAAIELFQNRRKSGIGGVIFTPEFEIPNWTSDEKAALAKTKLFVSPQSMRATSESMLHEAWKNRADKVALKLVDLSKSFNQSSRTRGVWFIENDEIKFNAHRDVIANNGFIHLHCDGPSMICLTPTGPFPMPVQSMNKEGTYFDPQEIKRLFHEQLLRPIGLLPKQAIAFDETMVHFSQAGKRFRILTFDRT